MSKTAVGLFENPAVAEQVVHDLDASNLPQTGIRTLVEPLDMAVTGVMSFPHTDFEVGLDRELKAIGANEREANAYAQGVRRGGVLVFATGSNKEVDNAAEIMNRHGAMEVEELVGRAPSNGSMIEPNTGSMIGDSVPSVSDSSFQTGRTRQSGGGARMFVW
jgi:hypothetical protein